MTIFVQEGGTEDTESTFTPTRLRTEPTKVFTPRTVYVQNLKTLEIAGCYLRLVTSPVMFQ